MDLAIVQRMVCPMQHALTPLVVRVDRADHARMQEGVLGCPACGGEWPVRDGTACFGPRAETDSLLEPGLDALAAFLALTEPKLVIVDGAPGSTVDSLVRSYGSMVIAFDADPGDSPATLIDGAPRAPLADHIANGAVLLRPRPGAFVESVVRAVARDGRIVAVSAIDVPSGVREIARSEELWVGEREAPVITVPLRRNR